MKNTVPPPTHSIVDICKEISQPRRHTCTLQAFSWQFDPQWISCWTESTVWNQHCWCDMKPTSSFDICIQCAQLGSIITKIRWIRGNLCCRDYEEEQQLKTGISCVLNCLISICEPEKKAACPTETGRAVTGRKSAWFLASLTKRSCSHLSCFIMSPGGLKNILTHHVSLLTSRLVHPGYNVFV